MSFAAAHQPRLRAFCCLLAAFWTGMILLGAMRLAFAAPSAPHSSPIAAVPHAVHRCPMCAAMAGMGIKSGMKCCCCAGGKMSASCVCACRPQSPPATLAVLVWSPLAVLPVRQAVIPPLLHPTAYPAAAPSLTLLFRSPPLRPPRLL